MYYKWLKLMELVKTRLPIIAKENKPQIILSFDDGKDTDYEIVYPILREEGVLAEICVITGKIGQPGYLDNNKLQTIEDSGWEIVSHTTNHNPLNTSFLLQSSSRGKNMIFIEYPYRYQPGCTCILDSGRTQEVVEVAASDQHCLYLREELKNSFPRYTQFRVTEEQARHEIIGSKKYLLDCGHKTENFTFPYNAYAHWALELVGKNYYSARAGARVARINTSIAGYNRYFLASVNYEYNKLTKEQSVKLLDSLVQRGGVCFFHAHSANPGFNLDLLRFIIHAGQKRKIRFTTRKNLREGIGDTYYA